MATRFSFRSASRRCGADPFPVARWLDEKGAPLLLAAILAVVALAATDLAPARSTDGQAGRHFLAE